MHEDGVFVFKMSFGSALIPHLKFQMGHTDDGESLWKSALLNHGFLKAPL